MKDSIRRKFEKFEREKAFFTDNAADFPADKPGGIIAAANAAIVAEIQQLSAAQLSESNVSEQATGDKDELLDRLLLTLRNINRAANAFEDEIPGTDQMFRLPRNRSLANLLAAGRAAYADSAALEAEFINYGMDAAFRADLLALIGTIETAEQRGDSGDEQRGAAVAGLTDAAKRGMNISRRADSIVRIKYSANPQKLAAWAIASHLEAAPKRKKPTDTPANGEG